ncbi:MAG: FAD-dependent oxidoreductase [Firmicutes bacterium]|nr:FAD-dependent oxidoreductase [Bacillota bacterium]
MGKRILVVGGVAGGAGAAVKARRTSEDAEIVIFERTPYVSWANCGLPYYIGGIIQRREELFIVNPGRLASRFNIDVRTRHEVTAIDRSRKTISVRNLETGDTRDERYEALILATGTEPARLPIPGLDSPRVFTLVSVEDADRLQSFLEEHRPANAAVIGGGFIGLETVEALLERGIAVTLVEMMDHLLPPVDREMAEPLAIHLRDKGVRVLLGEKVAGITENGTTRKLQLKLASGNTVACDFVISAVGVAPRLDLARQAGLSIGQAGGVVVNDRMQTSDPDIYAAGDICEIRHLVTGKPVRVPLAGPANKQARVAGANAAGGNMRYAGSLGTMIVKVCDLTIAKTGLSEREASFEGIPHYVSYTHSQHHAGYYPGARMMTVKLVVDRFTGRVLGAQIVGGAGVDKRIDVIATAIHARMTVEDLEDLDLAYAPPYSSAKDPVNIAGSVAANIHRGEVDAIGPDELEALLKREEIQLVDVRTPAERNKTGEIPGARLMPIDQLRELAGELDPHKKTVVYCAVGYRSYLAYKILKQRGFDDVSHLAGGFDAWKMFHGKPQRT